MPISWEWHNKIEGWVKPCGSRKWSTEVLDRLGLELADKEQTVIVDAGCGVDSWIIRELRNRGLKIRVIGFDIDDSCLRNKDVDEAKIASIYDIPIGSGSADVVLSSYVFEHVDDPDAALSELHRILKPGACLIFWTPNRYNPVMLLSAVTSQRFHVLLRRLTWGSEGADNAPTYYRMNSQKTVKQMAKRHGFVCEHIGTYSSAYAYFRMTKITFLLACIANKIMAFWPLTKLRLTILCVLRKPEA